MHQQPTSIELGQANPDLGKPVSLPKYDLYGNSFDNLDQYKCYGYLSMLAKYIEVTKNMTEEEMKLYLVRAEYRYFHYATYIHSLLYNSASSLDVAIFMQEHKANPYIFEDDCVREFSCKRTLLQIEDFDAIVNHHNQNELPPRWTDKMGSTEPPHLTKDNILGLSQDGYAELTCIVCYVDLRVKWQDFAEWRLDHKVALCCHRCNSRFTMDHVGKANLITDLHRSTLVPDPAYMRGNIGKTHAKILPYVKSIHDLKSLPFDSGLNAIKDYLVKNQKEAGEKDDASIDEFIEAARDTYFGSPYICTSSDLIKELATNYAFHYAATQTLKWTAKNFSTMPLDYLHLTRLNEVAAKKPNLLPVSTYRTEIARRTHLARMRRFEVNGHEDIDEKRAGVNPVIPHGQEDKYIQITKSEWNVLRAKQTRIDCTRSIKKTAQTITSFAKSGRLYDKYDAKEAYISRPDSYKDFKNLKFMSQYSTLRSLDKSASDWSTFSFTKVLTTTGSEIKLMKGRSLKSTYYPYTSNNPKFNWRDANLAWIKAFENVKHYSSVELRWYSSTATIGSPMRPGLIQITFNEALAIAARNRILAKKKKAEELARRKQRSSRSGGGGGGNSSSYSYGGSEYTYSGGGSSSYDSGSYGCDSGGGGGDSGGGGCDSGGGGW